MVPQRLLLLIASCLAIGLCNTVQSADRKPKPETILAGFTKNWDDSVWWPKRFRGGYMRPLADSGWKERMKALQALVQSGKEAVPVLVKALNSGTTPERILAAQTLGYLAPHAPVDALVEAAKNDAHPSVRLYAIDSLGMQGKAAKDIDWKSIAAKQRNRDVKMHVKYARERKGAAVGPEVVSALTKWDAKTIDTATVSKPAPEFQLKSAQGKQVKLSDYKGKQAVVLVFIYGDT